MISTLLGDCFYLLFRRGFVSGVAQPFGYLDCMVVAIVCISGSHAVSALQSSLWSLFFRSVAFCSVDASFPGPCTVSFSLRTLCGVFLLIMWRIVKERQLMNGILPLLLSVALS